MMFGPIPPGAAALLIIWFIAIGWAHDKFGNLGTLVVLLSLPVVGIVGAVLRLRDMR